MALQHRRRHRRRRHLMITRGDTGKDGTGQLFEIRTLNTAPHGNNELLTRRQRRYKESPSSTKFRALERRGKKKCTRRPAAGTCASLSCWQGPVARLNRRNAIFRGARAALIRIAAVVPRYLPMRRLEWMLGYCAE